MQRTPNLGLPQFEPSDKYRLEDYNEAYMKIDEKVKELNDKEAQLDTKLAEAQSIIDTWTQFKNTGGVINGDIKLPRGFALCGTINGNRDALIYQSSQPNDNGRVIVGSSGQTTQIASELKPEVYWNLQTHHILLDSDFVSNINSNGYTKLPNGLIMQWGSNTSWAGGKLWVAYPISFTKGTLSVSVSSKENVEKDCKTILSVPDSNTIGFNVSSNVNQIGFFWLAIGY